jgi:hypothetical protein
MKYKHYAPKAELILLDAGVEDSISYISNYSSNDFAVIAYSESIENVKAAFPKADIYDFGPESDKATQAHRLFKILRDTDYQWKKAIYLWKYDRFICDDMSAVNMHNLIAIENDPRNKYVQCNNCGAVIENTEEAKAAHANEYKSISKCTTCERLIKSKIEDKTISTDTISEDEFEVTHKSTYKMYCRYNMKNNLLSEAKESKCKYMLCNKFETLGGIHSTYPGLFNKLATSANLTEDKWTFKENDGSMYSYKARKRFTLHAYVNKMGIIRYFKLKHDDFQYTIMYSQKYDKIFSWDDVKNDWVPLDTQIPETVYENVRAFIANIYKEA